MTGDGVLYGWSGGKDAMYGLDRIQDDVDDVTLFTTYDSTVDDVYDRVSIHGVPKQLVQAQADALGMPLLLVDTGDVASISDFDAVMEQVYDSAQADGITTAAFGDLYLEDVRESREQRAAEAGMAPWFPIWGMDTDSVAQEFIDAGYRAVVVAVDGTQLSKEFVGRPYDRAFLDALPAKVDACGEDGAFHTFVYDGPLLDEPVPFREQDAIADASFAYMEGADERTVDIVTKQVPGGENHYVRLTPGQ